MELYRVIPYLEDAAAEGPGGPLHVPSIQGAGRVDNPEHYRVLYLSDAPDGAVGEAFGSYDRWTDDRLRGHPSLPGSVTALATYRFDGEPLDLDDPAVLVERSLRPSRVVTRHRATTQRWALDVWQERRWPGVRWWSFWWPGWGSIGLWALDDLTEVDVTPLTPDHPALVGAQTTLTRPWRGRD